MIKRALVISLLFSFRADFDAAYGEATKLVVAYASPAATFCPGWIARREGIFAKYNLDVEMVLMQGASAYMPALANGNIQVLYGGGTAVSRAIATKDFDVMVIATETRYVPVRLMVNASIHAPTCGAKPPGSRLTCITSALKTARSSGKWSTELSSACAMPR